MSIISKKEKQTIQFYNQHAQQWANDHGSDSKASFWTQELADFKR